MLWDRKATLQINDKCYYFDTMAFDFSVPFEDSTKLQTADFNIYNLSENTRNNIEKGDFVILNAGYEGDIGLIFSGGVDGCTSRHNGTEWITKITAITEMHQALGCTINKTYKRLVTAENIVRDLLNLFQIEVGTLNLVVNNTYPRGRVCQGKVRELLEEIVVEECKSRFLIRDGKIHINNPTVGFDNGLTLTPSNGLFPSNGDEQQTVIATPNTKNLDDEGKEQEEKTKAKSLLLNHRIGAAEIINFRDSLINGTYMVKKGKHTGSRTGKWQTDMDLLPL